MRNKSSSVDESSSRWIVSGSAMEGVSARRASRLPPVGPASAVLGGLGIENRERNHPDVVFSVNECIRKRTRSRDTRTTSASGESNSGCVVGCGGAAELSSAGAAGGSSHADAMKIVVADKSLECC